MTQRKNNQKKFNEGIVLENDAPLAKGLKVWQSLIQLSKGKFFRERYDLKVEGFTREEDVQEMLRSGWYLGAAASKAMQFNGKRFDLSGRWGKRAALLVNFKDRTVRIITREPTDAQKTKIEECESRLKRIPLVVESAEALKARIWA